MQAFNQLVSDLEDPIAVSGSGSVFSYAPCFVSIAPGGMPCIPHETQMP